MSGGGKRQKEFNLDNQLINEVTYGEWFFCIAPRHGRANNDDATASVESCEADAQEAPDEKENHTPKDTTQARGEKAHR